MSVVSGLRRLFFIALFVGIACAGQSRLGAQDELSARPGFKLLWAQNVPALRALRISPQGTRIAMFTGDNRVAVWLAETGAPLWSKDNVPGTDIRISDGAGYVFVFDPMNPLDHSVDFYSADTGQFMSKATTDGAIWSLDVCETGDYMAAGTGSGSLYIYTLNVPPTSMHVPLRGVCDKLDFAPDGSYVACGLWNASGIDKMDTNGNLAWSSGAPATLRYDATVTYGSRFIDAIAYRNHKQTDPSLTLWQRDDRRLWSYLPGSNSYGLRAITNSTGTFTVVSYYEMVQRDDAWTPVRRLVALDAQGKELFHIGGVYLSLTVMCLSPDDNGFIAYDGDLTLFRFNAAGSPVAKYPLTNQIRAWSVTADSRLLAIHTVDDKLALLQLS